MELLAYTVSALGIGIAILELVKLSWRWIVRLARGAERET